MKYSRKRPTEEGYYFAKVRFDRGPVQEVLCRVWGRPNPPVVKHKKALKSSLWVNWATYEGHSYQISSSKYFKSWAGPIAAPGTKKIVITHRSYNDRVIGGKLIKDFHASIDGGTWEAGSSKEGAIYSLITHNPEIFGIEIVEKRI
jgi:hypothetical protein